MRTLAGRDLQARVMGDTASDATGAYAPANYIGVTADATAPDDTRTTLPGEVVGGTLARGQATYAHTNGTASYTLTRTLTSDQTIVLRKFGVFNAPAGGTMAFETTLNAPAELVSGDALQITEVVSL